MDLIYKTKITNIGDKAADFENENMIILFGEEAPAALAEYCFKIKVTQLVDKIGVGEYLCIGQDKYRITAVGNVVEKNLDALGHITIKFNGADKADLPGTLYVEKKPLPKIQIGTVLSIKEN